MKRRDFVCASVLLACLASAAPAGPPDAPGRRVVRKVEVGGEGGWDYLTFDSASRRLYIPRSTRVMVFDADTLAVVGEVSNANTTGVHGVAIAPELSRGFTSNGRSNTVTIFDTKTLKTIADVKVTGENPDAILYDPATKRVFAFNGRTANATVIEAATGEVAGTIALDGKPEFAASDLAGHVFVNIEDKSIVTSIDAKKLTVESRWPLLPCEEPSGLAIDREHKRLFAGCHNKLMAVMDSASGKVVATVPIGEGVDANAFDPGTGLAYASCGDGTLTIAKAEASGKDSFKVVETVATQQGARTMALDEKTHTIVLAAAQFGPPPSPTPDNPRPRRTMVPGSFVLLVVR
ncbi:MAG TPA: YncE family protein [Thermoanaerobaculia bacterium]|nr:YncE family protein [Thermoanaerobaculia bacterium]